MHRITCPKSTITNPKLHSTILARIKPKPTYIQLPTLPEFNQNLPIFNYPLPKVPTITCPSLIIICPNSTITCQNAKITCPYSIVNCLILTVFNLMSIETCLNSGCQDFSRPDFSQLFRFLVQIFEFFPRGKSKNIPKPTPNPNRRSPWFTWLKMH